VLITDHNVRETLGICERAYIVSQGVVIASGSAEQILANPRSVRCTWARISNCRLGSNRTMMKPSLQLRIGQQLTMTPQLQQAIRLLQLPALDLQAHVRETLETNVMLEAEDERAGRVPERLASARTPQREKYAELDGSSARPRSARRSRRSRSPTRPGKSSASGPRTRLVGRRRPQRRFQRPAGPDAAGTADRAARARQLSPIDLAIARVITDAITDDGYLQGRSRTFARACCPKSRRGRRRGARARPCSRWSRPGSVRAI
jgi:hypothetical protein